MRPAAGQPVQSGADRVSSWGWSSPVPATAAAAVILATAMWLWPNLTPSGQVVDNSEADVADWMAPSAAFLQFRAGELLDLTPDAYSTPERRNSTTWAQPSDALIQAAEKAADQEIHP